MGKPLYKISKEEFGQIALDGAMVLKTFDVTGEKPVAKEDVICLTSGDVSVSCVPRIQDLGSDINGCPDNLAELVDIMGWDCGASFTALTSTPAFIAESLGASLVAGNKVTPTAKAEPKNFEDRWIVAKKMGGGVVAACLKKAMSTGGLNMATVKNGKGRFTVTLTAHPSVEDEDPTVPPIEFYSTEPSLGK